MAFHGASVYARVCVCAAVYVCVSFMCVCMHVFVCPGWCCAAVRFVLFLVVLKVVLAFTCMPVALVLVLNIRYMVLIQKMLASVN